MTSLQNLGDLLRTNPRPQYWSSAEVKMWLEAIGLDIYIHAFEAAGIQGADLISMDADGLKRRLGVSSLGHRSQMMQHIALLSAKASQNFKREESSKVSNGRKIDSMYPDKAARQLKAAQEEKLIEARAKYWSLEERNALLGQAIDPAEVGKRPPPKPAEPGLNSELIKRTTAPIKSIYHDQQRFIDPPMFDRERTVPVRGDRVGNAPSTIRQRHGNVQKSSQVLQMRRTEARGETNEILYPQPQVPTQEDEAEESPAKKLVRLSDTIKKLESEAKYEELVRAWVEYGACVRMEHSDTHPLLVRTHFSIATTYLRQKMVVQALQHFKASEEINSCNDYEKDKEAANFRCRQVFAFYLGVSFLTFAN